MTYYDLLGQPNLFQLLTKFDRDIADLCHRSEHCLYCPGKLDWASYLRSGYGMPANATDEEKRRFSFCCRRCRRRRTPDSLRFLDRKAFPGVIITLLAALEHGDSPERLRELRAKLGVDRRTLDAWRRWWRDRFAVSAFWRGARGLLPTAGADVSIPARLVAAFSGEATSLDTLIAIARFLSPWRHALPD